MNLFSNLLDNLVVGTLDACSGNGSGGACIVCGASCDILCVHGCGAFTCGISCSSYSTSIGK